MWTPDLEIGHQEIDRDHQNLIALINRIARVDNASVGADGDVAMILAELADYTLYHFEHEESLMERSRYDGNDEHKAQHSRLMRQLAQVIADFERGRLVTAEILGILKSWLLDHVMHADKKLSTVIKR